MKYNTNLKKIIGVQCNPSENGLEKLGKQKGMRTMECIKSGSSRLISNNIVNTHIVNTHIGETRDQNAQFQ